MRYRLVRSNLAQRPNVAHAIDFDRSPVLIAPHGLEPSVGNEIIQIGAGPHARELRVSSRSLPQHPDDGSSDMASRGRRSPACPASTRWLPAPSPATSRGSHTVPRSTPATEGSPPSGHGSISRCSTHVAAIAVASPQRRRMKSTLSLGASASPSSLASPWRRARDEGGTSELDPASARQRMHARARCAQARSAPGTRAKLRLEGPTRGLFDAAQVFAILAALKRLPPLHIAEPMTEVKDVAFPGAARTAGGDRARRLRPCRRADVRPGPSVKRFSVAPLPGPLWRLGGQIRRRRSMAPHPSTNWTSPAGPPPAGTRRACYLDQHGIRLHNPSGK